MGEWFIYFVIVIVGMTIGYIRGYSDGVQGRWNR